MYKIYEVQPGDTLESIARMTGTTVEELRKINGFSMNNLSVGQRIIVPDQSEQVFEVYEVKPGDTMYAIAKKYHARVDDLLKLNGLNEDDFIYPKEEIFVPKESVSFLITDKGDTTMGVATELGVSFVELMMQNEDMKLEPDQLLIVKKEQM